MSVMLLQMNLVGLASIAGAVAGSLLAFLLFNRNPEPFHGRHRQPFLGGMIGRSDNGWRNAFLFVPLSAIFIAETLFVVLQVSYFKLTKPYTPDRPMSKPTLILYKLTQKLPGEGKRLFRMAPLHHHFEAVLAEKKIDEWQVVAGFWIVQAAICLLVLSCFFFLR